MKVSFNQCSHIVQTLVETCHWKFWHLIFWILDEWKFSMDVQLLDLSFLKKFNLPEQNLINYIHKVNFKCFYSVDQFCRSFFVVQIANAQLDWLCQTCVQLSLLVQFLLNGFVSFYKRARQNLELFYKAKMSLV